MPPIRLNKNDRERLSARLLANAELASKPALDAAGEAATVLIESRVSAFMTEADRDVLAKFGLTATLTALQWGYRKDAYTPGRYVLPRPVVIPKIADMVGTAYLDCGNLKPLALTEDDFLTLILADKAWFAECSEVLDSIRAALAGCKTDAQLLELWPEAAPIVAEVLGQQVVKPTLPAPEIVRATLPRLNVRLLTSGEGKS